MAAVVDVYFDNQTPEIELECYYTAILTFCQEAKEKDKVMSLVFCVIFRRDNSRIVRGTFVNIPYIRLMRLCLIEMFLRDFAEWATEVCR